MSTRKTLVSHSPYEPILGMARAVRIGNVVAVAGTAPIDADGRTAGHYDPAAQARRCFEIARDALAGLGASLEDVIRTRILLVRIGDWPVVAAVHGEVFHAIRPVTTVMQVSRFIDRDWLVEIEVDAVVEAEGG